MHLFFIDDSKQNSPSRQRMGALCAIGGLSIHFENVKAAEKAINEVCENFEFPKGEVFKWSPGRDLWMRSNLIDDRRREFFINIISVVSSFAPCFFVVIEDTHYRSATGLNRHDIDCIKLFLERAQGYLVSNNSKGIIIADRIGGARQDEECVLEACLNTLISGTDYLIPDRLILNVLPVFSRYVRLLQVADLITSCTLSFVSGENRHSPPIFEKLKPHFHAGLNGISGSGIKIHPDFKYVNLYHWLFGLTEFYRGNVGVRMPISSRPYGSDPYTY